MAKTSPPRQLTTILLLLTLTPTLILSQPFPTANSEPIFGTYTLSLAVDPSKCPKSLKILPQKPFFDITTSITIPLQNLIFDSKPCASPSANKKLVLDFGGDSDGLDENVAKGACFKDTVVTVFSDIPNKNPNGTFDSEPARIGITGKCQYCEYSKPFAGVLKTGLDVFPGFEEEKKLCIGKESDFVVVTPTTVVKPSPRPRKVVKKRARYYLRIKSKGRCHGKGLLVNGGVRWRDRGLVRTGASIVLKVTSGRRTFMSKARAFCGWKWRGCRDWRSRGLWLFVPKRRLEGNVKIEVLADWKPVESRNVWYPRWCKKRRY